MCFFAMCEYLTCLTQTQRTRPPACISVVWRPRLSVTVEYFNVKSPEEGKDGGQTSPANGSAASCSDVSKKTKEIAKK